MQVTVGYEGKVTGFEVDIARTRGKRAHAYEVLDLWLAFHASAVIENIGDYGQDEWDLIKGTVSRSSNTLMFAARPCNGPSAMFCATF